MNRRNSLKALLVGGASASIIAEACKSDGTTNTQQNGATNATAAANDADRMAEEKLYNKSLEEQTFFTPEEMATITILADIIIPKDEVSGSASDAKVANFIEFMVKDRTENQTPMRGGLRWLELQSNTRFDKPFARLTETQRLQIVDDIAYPLKAKPEFKQGVAFFSLMRNLTISGFYTTQIGVNDIGYMGNKPNQWNGVPDDVLKQYNIAYTERELKECVSF
jgi:hypothetical protein